jgi:hypothetical protein
VADDDGPVAPEGGDEARGVLDERRQVVRPAELGAAVAPQVGGDGAVAGSAERAELMPPRATELGKAVEAEDERPVLGPLGERMECDSVRAEDERLDT